MCGFLSFVYSMRMQVGKNKTKSEIKITSSYKIKVMAVHGWLDNASSFDLLAPYLAAHGIHVVCE